MVSDGITCYASLAFVVQEHSVVLFMKSDIVNGISLVGLLDPCELHLEYLHLDIYLSRRSPLVALGGVYWQIDSRAPPFVVHHHPPSSTAHVA